MGISVKSNGLSQSQNAEFESFYNDLFQRYRYQQKLNFTSVNNQLRFTERVLSSSPNYVSISTLTSNKDEQRILSDALLNFYVNNNKIKVNFAAQMAFIPLLFSNDSNYHRNNVDLSITPITDSTLINKEQKSRLITNFRIDSMRANQQIVTNLALNLSGWFKQRSNLQFRDSQNIANPILQNVSSSANINFNLMLNSLLTNSSTQAKQEIDNIIANFDISGSFSSILNTFSSNVVSPNNNFDSAVNITGNTPLSVNQNLSTQNARIGYGSNNFSNFISAVSNYVNTNAYDQQGSPISVEQQLALPFNANQPLLPNDAKFLTATTINTYASQINNCNALGLTQ